ncbi:MAG: sugar phosphate isomerase/epimerase [Acidobacteriota bacterium]
MQKLTRREWNKLALSGLVVTALPVKRFAKTKMIDSRVKGVLLGAQSYSFRDRPVDKVVEAMAAVGLGSCELWDGGHVSPATFADSQLPRRDALRQWRIKTGVGRCKEIRQLFNNAGVDIYAFNYSFRDDFTDEELDKGFQMAQALGARCITASGTVSVAKRVDGYAKKYKMRVGFHNHSNIKENEYATAEDFAKAMQGTSEYICVNLDIGHFTAANFDAVDYLSKNYQRIVTLHIKDRKRNQGANLPFGEGDTPIKQVLAFLRDKKLKIPANIEYEYKGSDTLEEMKNCFAYCKQALLA